MERLGLVGEAQTEHSLICLLLFSKPGSKALEESSLGQVLRKTGPG